MSTSQTVEQPLDRDNGVPDGRPAESILRGFGPLRERVDSVDLVLGLSVLLLIITSDKSPLLLAIALVVAGVTIWRPQLCRSPYYWFAIAGFLAVRNLAVWLTLDDHIVVANYWFVVLGLSFMTNNPGRIIAHNARWLIGLVFLFATLWKATSMEYMSGAFFEYTLLLDDRFLPLARWIGGVDTPQLAENYQRMAEVRDPAGEMNHFFLNSTLRVDLLAQLLTWWTVVIEGLLAVCFLLSRVSICRALRNPLLILFALTTYVPVPVTGFCATLMVLGIAQTLPRERRSVAGYLVTLGLILVWTPIWRNLIYIG